MSSGDKPAARRPSVYRLALRRQLVVGAAWWLAYLVVRYPGAYPTLVAFLLLPALFAWSMRAYRIAAGLFVASLTLGAVNLSALRGLSGSEQALWYLGALLQCTAMAPARFLREGRLSDLWAYAGPLRLLDAEDGPLQWLTRTAKPLLLLGSSLILVGVLLLATPYRTTGPFSSTEVKCGSVLSPERSGSDYGECDRGGRAANGSAVAATGLALVWVALFVIGRRPRLNVPGLAKSEAD